VLVTTLALTLAPPRTRGGVRIAFQDALVGSVLVAVLAQWRIDLGIVPITGQTLGVLLVGAAYGPGFVGWLARRGWDRTFRSSVSAMLPERSFEE
jgi:hypothetical protein